MKQKMNRISKLAIFIITPFGFGSIALILLERNWLKIIVLVLFLIPFGYQLIKIIKARRKNDS